MLNQMTEASSGIVQKNEFGQVFEERKSDPLVILESFKFEI
jgi:hypothetical protein